MFKSNEVGREIKLPSGNETFFEQNSAQGYEARDIINRFRPLTVHMNGSCVFFTVLQLE